MTNYLFELSALLSAAVTALRRAEAVIRFVAVGDLGEAAAAIARASRSSSSSAPHREPRPDTSTSRDTIFDLSSTFSDRSGGQSEHARGLATFGPDCKLRTNDSTSVMTAFKSSNADLSEPSFLSSVVELGGSDLKLCACRVCSSKSTSVRRRDFRTLSGLVRGETSFTSTTGSDDDSDASSSTPYHGRVGDFRLSVAL